MTKQIIGIIDNDQLAAKITDDKAFEKLQALVRDWKHKDEASRKLKEHLRTLPKRLEAARRAEHALANPANAAEGAQRPITEAIRVEDEVQIAGAPFVRQSTWEFIDTEKYAAPEVQQKLQSVGNYGLLAIGEGVAFNVSKPLAGFQSIQFKASAAERSTIDLMNPSRQQLEEQIDPSHGAIASYLQKRAKYEAPGRFRYKVGVRRITMPRADVGQPLQIEGCPQSYWSEQEFNRRILLDPWDQELQSFKRAALDRVLKPHDNHIEITFPSALYLELALVTADDKLILLRKNWERHVTAKSGRNWTCTIEEGFRWNEHVTPTGLDIARTLDDGLEKELGLRIDMLSEWKILGVALEYTHLNCAHVGYGRLKTTSTELEPLMASIRGGNSEDFKEVEFLPVFGSFEECQSRGDCWHPLALLRIYLATRALEGRSIA